MHTVDATSSTLPSALEEAAVTGAAAYAALAWASFAINRVNVGGADTWRSLYTWGQERLAPFGRGPAPPNRRKAAPARPPRPPPHPGGRGPPPRGRPRPPPPQPTQRRPRATPLHSGQRTRQ